MCRILAIFIALVCVYAANAQYVKSVKGGHQGGYYREYNPGAKLPNFHGNSTQGGFSSQNRTQMHVNYDIGVCYIEVPTASLVHNQAHIPAGNGSRPELSRIRSCCQGYIRNIHNFWICDPVCTQECVNALCTAPDTCSCFPDHVKNLAGFCIPTCPIGCQNGQCAGGECLCKEGFALDSESKYCFPSCKESCGGIGNCTAPNTCDCKKGYHSTPTGNCKPVCEKCENGDCVAPNECRCKHGYERNPQSVCVPQCHQNCAPNGKCVAPGKCEYPETTTPLISPTFRPSPNIPLYPGNQVYAGNNTQPGNYSGPYPGQQSGYPGQPGQSGYPGQSGQPGQTGYPGQSGQSGQTGYPGQAGQPGQRGYPSQPGPNGQPGQPGYPSQYPGYPSQSGHPNQHQPESQSTGQGNQGYGNQNHAYPPSSGLSGNQVNTGVQGQQLYPDIQQYNQEYEPDCLQPCVNGFCVEGNRCQCNKGFLLDKSDPTESRCIPHCAGGCLNGVCSAPNFCICNMGYYKDHSVKGRPQCVKRNKRSVEETPNIAKFLVFDFPEMM
ncbi:fibrillin-1-like isoform X1 [Pieris napi]|uniref:fibrillin-1-like isoform X1 n=1 Tax=Pieris napi TaxID=78633 RepID=UPI001FB8A6B6|nr:fibrillin-1-like isoform X1 [Pieris napi]